MPRYSENDLGLGVQKFRAQTDRQTIDTTQRINTPF